MKEIFELPYFTLKQFSLYYSSQKIALVNISRLLKSKDIFKIREGFYVHKNYINNLKIENNMDSYIEFIASNIVYSPSYISLEYVLFENNIITENTYSITSVSSNKTAKFENIFGKFNYRTIKKDLFGDYEIIKKDGFIIYKATKEKALFDYFYLKTNIIFDLKYFEELRLNTENINFLKLEKIIKKSNSTKMNKVFIYLKKLKGL